MKKSIKIIFILLVLFPYINVNALTKSELTIMNLDKIHTVEKPTNYTSVQGGTTKDKYIVTLFINEGDDKVDKTALMLLDKKTFKKVKRLDNPILEYDFGHANDATYNSKTKELLVLAGRKIYILNAEDDSFSLKKIQKLSYYYHGLGYDEVNDQYVLSRTIHKGTRFEIMDTSFKRKSSFSIKTNLTKQSLTVHEGYIYYVCYEAGMLTKYQDVYDGLLKRKENLIYVYDVNGKKKTIYYIPYSYKEIIFGEIENISFIEDRILIQFNHVGKAGYFTPIFQNEVNATIKIKTEDETDDKVYSLKTEDEEVQRVRKYNNHITYSLRYVTEGEYKYNIEEQDIKKMFETEEEQEELDITEEEQVQENEEDKLIVNVYYDPTINMFRYNSNSKDLTFKEGKLELKEKPVIEEKEVIPDTKTMG